MSRTEFDPLAELNGAVDLGRGYPDFPPPEHITKALAEVANDDCLFHQYTRGYGHPRLVKVLSQIYSKALGCCLDPMTDILITVGADEALFDTVQGLVNVGDEVIIVEPFYDSYEPIVKIAGGICKFIPLKPNKPEGSTSSADWVLDCKELCSLFNKKTKMIIINSPHNPSGKIYSEEELKFIAELCKMHDVICVSDEVYEWIVYPPYKHIKMATIPGMWDRTITIGSAGKAFSITGWKIGWAYGATKLMEKLKVVHTNSVYVCSTPLQEALARGLEKEVEFMGTDKAYGTMLPKMLLEKREFMVKMIKDAGMIPIVPQGGYCILAGWTPLKDKVDLKDEKDPQMDYKFTKFLSKHVKVQAIPPSAFFTKANRKIGEPFIRFCFVKKEETLKAAAANMQKWAKTLK